jgi:hypothetical protein
MRVAVDDNGYFYDLDTGYYLTIEYDYEGAAYNAASGEPVEFVDLSAIGGPSGYTVYYGGGFDWNNLVNIAGQTAVGIAGGAGQTGRYIPIGGGQPQGQYPGPGQTPAPRPIGTSPGGSSGGSVNLGVFGNVPLLPLGVAGLLFTVFILGQAKGKR